MVCRAVFDSVSFHVESRPSFALMDFVCLLNTEALVCIDVWDLPPPKTGEATS